MKIDQGKDELIDYFLDLLFIQIFNVSSHSHVRFTASSFLPGSQLDTILEAPPRRKSGDKSSLRIGFRKLFPSVNRGIITIPEAEG